jgi:hypothetical protein
MSGFRRLEPWEHVIVADHEARHAVAALHLGVPLREVELDPPANDRAYGVARFHEPEVWTGDGKIGLLDRKLRLQRALVVSLVGPMGDHDWPDGERAGHTTCATLDEALECKWEGIATITNVLQVIGITIGDPFDEQAYQSVREQAWELIHRHDFIEAVERVSAALLRTRHLDGVEAAAHTLDPKES